MKVRFERAYKGFEESKIIPFVVEIDKGDDTNIRYYAGSTEEAKDFYCQYLLNNPDEFLDDVSYDLSSFLNAFSFINVSALANILGINESLMRHYSSGSKKPSAKQTKKIMCGIKELSLAMYKIGVIS